MPNSINALPSNFPLSHPTPSEDKARKIHRLLLDMARDESEKEVKSVIRKTADFFRENFFGKTRAQIKAAIVSVLEDYCDGQEAHPVEINNLAELTGIREKELKPALSELAGEKKILVGRRRRFNEPGEHYNLIYKLRK
ncbi:MAG: hypothetical protein JSS81_28645 [Acidobacteria bacterium]|nr:hypothetical protein [Acidobacteriota bacterium]